MIATMTKKVQKDAWSSLIQLQTMSLQLLTTKTPPNSKQIPQQET